MNHRLPWAYLVCALALAPSSALAHRPYGREAGTIERNDGQVVSIVLRHVDGILWADPVCVQFRLPDGTLVAQTPYAFDAIVHRTPSAIEVYQFRNNWLPVAGRVDVFDGYTLKDTTSLRRLRSLLIHFSDHWLGYVVTLGLGVCLVRVWAGLCALPNRSWRIPLRWTGLAFVAFAGILYVYDVLFFEPLSRLVLGVAAWLLVMTHGFRRGRKRPPTDAPVVA